MNKIINLLESQLLVAKKDRSSSYNMYLQNVDYRNIYAQFSTGAFEKNNIMRKTFNFFFSRIVYGLKIFKTKNYSKLKIINNRLNVALNINIIQHLFILKILKKNINPKTICVIGDGKANFAINAFLNFSNVKIYSINLPEVHINDYLILKKSKIISNKSICVITRLNQKVNNNKKLILITSNFKKFINIVNIDLFVSIACFQELNLNEQKNYLKIIKKKKNSYFYLCERKKKVLVGGEKNFFKNYYRKNFLKIFSEPDNFCRLIYNTKFPFIHKRDEFHHALYRIK